MSDAAAAVRKMNAARMSLEEAKLEVRRIRREQAEAQRAKADEERQQFRASLEDEGILHVAATQAVRDKVWEMAWDQGHSTGFHDVRYHYEDYADLVNLVIFAVTQ